MSNSLVHKCKISIKPNWEDLIEFANACKNFDLEHNFFENDINEENLDKFEKMLKENNANILIHNLLDVEQIVDSNNKSLTIAPSEGFSPLGLFQDTSF